MYVLGLLIAVVIGIILGLIGGGGSILTVPLVNYFFDTELLLATTYSLIIVTISSLFGFVQRVPQRNVDYTVALLFAIPSMLLAFSIRYWVMPLFPIHLSLGNVIIGRDIVITLLLIIVMLFTAIKTFKKSDDLNHIPKASSQGLVVLFGILTGFLSGFIGAGGGFIIVPLLMRIGLDMKKAVGTSMLIISIQSSVALIGDYFNPEIHRLGIDWILVGTLSGITIAGVAIGTAIQGKFSENWLRRFFAFILTIVAIGMLLKLRNY